MSYVVTLYEKFLLLIWGNTMEKSAKSRGGGGGKLNRSETVTIRLDLKLRYLTELAARTQRRTVSSFIEWAIEHAFDRIILREGHQYTETLGEQSEELWDIDEPDRLAKLALRYPELLTYDEQILWKLIRECGWLWKGRHDEDGYWQWKVKEEYLIFQRLREHWDAFKQVASGEADKSILPKSTLRIPTPPPADDFAPPLYDDDIPF